jgi:hypothetical protein
VTMAAAYPGSVSMDRADHCVLPVPVKLEAAVRSAGERHSNGSDIKREPAADGFQVSLFQGPERIETSQPLGVREQLQVSQFFGGEDRSATAARSAASRIFGTGGQRDCCPGVRVAQVERCPACRMFSWRWKQQACTEKRKTLRPSPLPHEYSCAAQVTLLRQASPIFFTSAFCRYSA